MLAAVQADPLETAMPSRPALTHQISPSSPMAQLMGMRAVYWVMTGLMVTAAAVSLTRGKITIEAQQSEVAGESVSTVAG